MDYKTINDYELIYLVKENDEAAHKLLYNKYHPLISQYAKKYYVCNKDIGLEESDLYQEGVYAFEAALERYDNDTCLFYTYVTICIKREMEKQIKRFRRHKHNILNEAKSLNKCIVENEDLYYEDIISDGKTNLENNLIDYHCSKKIYEFKHELEFDKANIYELKLNGFSNREIAQILDNDSKKIDNILRQIRNRFKKYYNKIEL